VNEEDEYIENDYNPEVDNISDVHDDNDEMEDMGEDMVEDEEDDVTDEEDDFFLHHAPPADNARRRNAENGPNAGQDIIRIPQ